MASGAWIRSIVSGTMWKDRKDRLDGSLLGSWPGPFERNMFRHESPESFHLKLLVMASVSGIQSPDMMSFLRDGCFNRSLGFQRFTTCVSSEYQDHQNPANR